MSRLDQIYRRLLLTKFFTKGWGKPENLKRLFDFRKILSNRELCKDLVSENYPIHIDKVKIIVTDTPTGRPGDTDLEVRNLLTHKTNKFSKYEVIHNDCRILEGHFKSPFSEHLPGIMPKETETAIFQMVLPLQWSSTLKPVCIHLAGTGDHYFWRRRYFMAKPLLKESGIASILLENPYYGTRKPKGQLRSSLHNVSDLFVMGGALMLESLVLLHWCQRQGLGPLGITGISMGGHMASLAATNWHEPLSLVPCLSWTTASAVFTQGVMSAAIPWKTLQTQFFENSIYLEEISKLLTSPEVNWQHCAYAMGQEFVKDFSNSFNNLQQLHKQFEENSKVSMEQSQKNTSSEGSKNTVDLDFPQSTKETATRRRGQENTSETDVHMMQASLAPLSGSGIASQSQSSLSMSSSSLFPLNLKNVLSKSKLSRALPKSKSLSDSGSNPATSSFRHLFSKSAQSDVVQHTLKQEAVNFMVGVMDECTHLGNFSMPVDPSLVIIVAATQDAYVPRQGVMPLDRLWPGAEVRYVNRGHIAAFLLHNNVFRKAIADSFDKQIKLYHQR